MTPFAPTVPGPKNPRLFGHLPEFRRDPLGLLTRIAREHGDFTYFRLGPQDTYLLNDPDLIKDVLVTRAANFTKSRVLQRARSLLGEGLLTSEGALHLRQRRLAAPAFHHRRIANYAAVMADCVVRARDCWTAGETRDIDEEMMRLTLAIVAKTLFSADVAGEQAAEIGRSLTAVLEQFNTMLLPYAELLQKLPLPASRRFQRARKQLDQVIYRLIAERRASGEDKGDLLSMLLLAIDEEGDGAGMTDKQARDEAMTIFLAGHETTANALTWTWYLLSQHPEVEQRFHSEIDEVLAGRAPSFGDLPRLHYTEMVLAESMRLYPPAWVIGRMPIQAFDLRVHTIAPRSVLLMSPFVTHRNPLYFFDPERFDPERFTPERKESRPKFAYFPFGGGPRICIGERFAWTEGILALAAIGQRWRLRLVPGHRVAPWPLITLRTRHGMRMVVESRS